MRLENYIRILAGTFVFLSATAGYLLSKKFLFFTMFVGLNLFQYGFTNICPLAAALKKLGIRE